MVQRFLSRIRSSFIGNRLAFRWFISSYCAVFDHSYIKVVVMAVYVAAVCLNYTVPSIPQSFQVSVFHISYFNWVMVAYVAAVYLKHKILPRALSGKFIVPAKAYNAMCRLQEVLLKLEDTGFSKIRTKVNALVERITESVWEFEDLLESNFTNQILPQFESERSHLSSLVLLCRSLGSEAECWLLCGEGGGHGGGRWPCFSFVQLWIRYCQTFSSSIISNFQKG